MTTLKSTLQQISITPGVQPSTDKTALATEHFTFADKIRFRFGFPQKIGGWNAILFNYSILIMGYVRSIFSAVISTSINTVIGTNTTLYSLSGSSLTNITPLVSAPVALLTNSLTSFGYSALVTNAISTIIGSRIVSVLDINYAQYFPGNSISLSGVTPFNGLTSGMINSAHVIHTIGTGLYTFVATASATHTGSGGGGSIIVTSGLMSVSAASHGMSNGFRVRIAGASTFGGFTSAQINTEFVLNNATGPNAFVVYTAGAATSYVNGGGTAATYQPQIASGAAQQSLGQGYGMGLYGAGLYGTALMSSSTSSYPRIWFMDRFGTSIIMSAGNQTGVYSWAGSNATAPALISGAPPNVNYAFVSDNILVTLGAGGVVNRIFASDQGNDTNWTSSSSNQVFDDTVVGASQFRSHVPVQGVNLIFTDHQTYLFSYIGLPLVWSIKQLENNIGIIGPMARCSVGGTAYWMDVNNFYMWSGGNVTIIPSNTQLESTIKNYVFSDINYGQSAKFFAWYNERFNEVWFHYCSASSNECDSVARVNIVEFTWVMDTFDRTAAEYPNLTLSYPRLASKESILYAHEQGVDADGSAMPWQLASNLRIGGGVPTNQFRVGTRATTMLTGFIPDSTQIGNINVEIVGQNYPQSVKKMFDNTYVVTPSTEFITVEGNARFWQYFLSGDSLGQVWTGGNWHEFVQQASPQ